jgi:2-methylfumaryl-CoA isomerase
MVVALTARQWHALQDVTAIHEACEKIEQATGHDLSTESGRFEARDLIAALLRPWFASRDLSEIRALFTGTGVSWGPYQTFRQLVGEDPRCSTANPMFEEVEHPGVGTYLMPGTPLDFSGLERAPVKRAPQLGEHSEEVLAEVVGFSGTEIGRLFDAGIVAGAAAAGGRAQPLRQT